MAARPPPIVMSCARSRQESHNAVSTSADRIITRNPVELHDNRAANQLPSRVPCSCAAVRDLQSPSPATHRRLPLPPPATRSRAGQPLVGAAINRAAVRGQQRMLYSPSGRRLLKGNRPHSRAARLRAPSQRVVGAVHVASLVVYQRRRTASLWRREDEGSGPQPLCAGLTPAIS